MSLSAVAEKVGAEFGRVARLDFLVLMAALLALCAALRGLEWAAWRSSGAFIDDVSIGHVPVLPTPDAYAWLAGAQAFGRFADWSLATLIGVIAWVVPVAPEWIAFWLPLGIAWLPGAVVAWVCWQRGYALAGLAAGVFAAASLGYLARTRLGYADTDLFALLVPTAFAALWAWAAERAAGLGSDDSRWFADLLGPVIGIVVWAGFGQWLYPSGYPVMLAILVAGVAVGGIVARFAAFGVFLGLAGYSLLAFHLGLLGVILGIGGVVWLVGWARSTLTFGVLILALSVCAVVLVDQAFLAQTIARIGAYAGWGAAPAPIGDWVLPRIDTSIEETSAVGWMEYVQRTGTHWMFLLGGLVGYAATVVRWPSLLTFLPLLGLGLASFELGHRFAMYAAPALGLGLGLGMVIVLERLAVNRLVHILAPLCLVAGITALVGWQVRDLEARPAVDPDWARALLSLREADSNQGRVWTWWDEGYPAQFYGRLQTMADGGNTSRLRTFALGQVFGAREPGRAAAFLRRSAAERQQSMMSPLDWRRASYALEPLATLTHLDAREVGRMLERSELLEPWDADALPDEFVVASWETLRKAQWADLYGRWKLTDGAQGYGKIATLRPPVRFDEASGILETGDGSVALRSIHILEADSAYRKRWTRPEGAHAIINNESGEGVLMDAGLFGTMAVQLLIADPAKLDRHFELVVDASPAARVFRVRASPAQAAAEASGSAPGQ